MSSNIDFVRAQITALVQSVQDMNILRKYYHIRESSNLYEWLELDSMIQSVKAQQNEKNIQNFLENIPFFKHNPQIFADLSNPEKNTKLVAGRVQSGKTAVICGLASYLVCELKMPTVVVNTPFETERQIVLFVENFHICATKKV
jgi:RecG-like helicase